MSERGGGQVVIRVHGVFDAAAAQRLANDIEGADPGELRVDLSDVRDFRDFEIAMLARALDGRSHVAVSGLRQHQLRLLRYFGIEAAADAGVAVELQ